MQFAVQDIRSFGNQKIFNGFYSSKAGMMSFIERLRIQNMMLIDYKATAYSLPKVYKNIQSDLIRYSGIIAFMNMCEPMILDIDKPDATLQRKFRNNWDSMWTNFGKDLHLNAEVVKMISDLGIRLCFVTEIQRIPDEIYKFYNAILKWYTYSVSEASIKELNIEPLELIRYMILMSSDEFICSLDLGFEGGY